MTTTLPNRKTNRLKNYDYTQPNYYYLTICSQHHLTLFGTITEDKMKLNPAGKMLKKWIEKLPQKFSEIDCEEYIIMPNHLHIIIQIKTTKKDYKPSIRKITQWYKTMTTNEYIRNIKNQEWKPFKEKLWQRNYYEHIIRNEQSLQNIKKYIQENPIKWKEDKYNPNDKNKTLN